MASIDRTTYSSADWEITETTSGQKLFATQKAEWGFSIEREPLKAGGSVVGMTAGDCTYDPLALDFPYSSWLDFCGAIAAPSIDAEGLRDVRLQFAGTMGTPSRGQSVAKYQFLDAYVKSVKFPIAEGNANTIVSVEFDVFKSTQS